MSSSMMLKAPLVSSVQLRRSAGRVSPMLPIRPIAARRCFAMKAQAEEKKALAQVRAERSLALRLYEAQGFNQDAVLEDYYGAACG
jgi:hypothetical protein